MQNRINYVSQLFITTEVYKVAIKENLMPTTSKAILDAIERGIERANRYDHSLNGKKVGLEELTAASIVSKGGK